MNQLKTEAEDIVDFITANNTSKVINLKEYGVVLFRNIYNEAVINGLNINVLEKGKRYEISR
jgi:hypothetical protein